MSKFGLKSDLTKTNAAIRLIVKILSAIAQFEEDSEFYEAQKTTQNFMVAAKRTMLWNRGKRSGVTFALGHENWRVTYRWKAPRT